MTASALTGDGIADVWGTIQRFVESTKASGVFKKRRQAQERDWLRAMIESHLIEKFYANNEIQRLLPALDLAVMSGEIPVAAAAQKLLDAFQVTD